MSRRRTVRRWHHVVGLVGPNEVKDLQRRVHDYHTKIIASHDGLQKAKPGTIPALREHDWVDLGMRIIAFEDENWTAWNPMNYVFAGAAYDRGRGLIEELDTWRDQLAAWDAPDVPAPLPVPHSDLGLAGGLGFALAAVVAIMVMRELK